MNYRLFLFCLLTLTSCAHTSVTRLNLNLTAKPKNCQVSIYTEPSAIDTRYEEVCLIASSAAYTNDAIQNAKEEACKCGADAILIWNVAASGNVIWGKQGHAMLKAYRLKK